MKVSQMEYKRMDVREVSQKLDDFILRFKNAENADEQLALDEEIGKYFEIMDTNMALANIRFTLNTKDEFYSKEKEYYDQVMPSLSVKMRELDMCYIQSKFKDELVKHIPEVFFTNKKLESETINDSVVEELKRENALVTEYTKLMSSIQIKFKNKIYTRSEISQFVTNSNRKIRRGACLAEGRAMRKVAKKLDIIFNELVGVRTTLAKKLGFKSFSEVGYRRLGRNCYDQNDIAKFRQNVKTYIVPLCTELKQKISSEMGWKNLMLYDNSVFTKTEPKPIGSIEEIFAKGKKMYQEMDSQTGELFETMTQAEAFDVVARDGKWGGGYCTGLPQYKLPFILANFNGSHDDIGVLTHEFGHALASYQAFNIPRVSARGSVTCETCEVHSMSMEFLTYQWMNLFFGENTQEYIFNHVASSLTFLPYGTIVDFFQQTVYDYYSLNASDRNDFWRQAEREYLPHLNNKGIPYYRTGRRWQQKAHIYETPFYYIDYCLAQMTAFQFLQLMQEDYKGAFKKYLQFVKLGGTKPFLDIIKEVGLKSPFEEETFAEVTETIRQMLKI